MKKFISDVLTISEIKEFNRRYLAAKMLYNGSTYEEIVKKLKMSKNTINRINFKLKHGEGSFMALFSERRSNKKLKTRRSYWSEEPIEQYLR